MDALIKIGVKFVTVKYDEPSVAESVWRYDKPRSGGETGLTNFTYD